MNNSKQIYLLPCKIAPNSHLSTISHLESQEPVLIKGYTIYFIISRLDMIGFSFYCVSVQNADKSCVMYQYTFDEALDFASLGFSEEVDTKSRIILHVSKQFLSDLDEREGTCELKKGNWAEEREKLEEIAALKHLGVIENLSAKTFKMETILNTSMSKFQKIYKVYGDLKSSLEKIFQELELASIIFGIGKVNEKISKIKNERNFCFGPLKKYLEKSNVVEMLFNFIPIPLNENRCVFNIVIDSFNYIKNILINNKYIESTMENSCSHEEFINGLNKFQIENNITKTDICDKKTIFFIVKKYRCDIMEPLPIFEMAEINCDFGNEENLPIIKNIDFNNDNNLLRHVTDEINKEIAFLPEPKIKVKSMTDKINEFTDESEFKCENLSSKLTKIEDKVTNMTGQIKEVLVDSQSAISRVNSASETLKNTFQFHKEIQDKFNILDFQLSEEEKKTRITLLIGIIISFLSAVRFLMI